jgi:hypothetical protein
MRRLELDFVKRARLWPLWLLLAIAVLFAFDIARGYIDLRQRLAVGERPVEVEAPPPQADAESLPEPVKRELDAARRVLHELSLPWGELFHSVEGAVGEDVAMLSVEPDAGRGQVRITGEARDYLAVLTLMARLEEAGTLTRVHLVSHEIREDDPHRPYYFALIGRWRSAP